MSVCYLCGNEMVPRPSDYFNEPEKYKGLAIRHEEHIIQNSLYGRLTDSDILCESCGGKLGTEIDAEFGTIFQGIIERIKHILASKDHGGNNFNRTLKGYIYKNDGSQIDVHIKEGKVLPVKPTYDYEKDENKVFIYCSKKVAKDYQKYVVKEMKAQGINTGNIFFEVVDDISATGKLGIFFSEGIEDFNLKLKLGLNKIATGFAVANGIDRTQLPCTLDIVQKKIIFTSNVVPFYPYAALDLVVEPFRVVLENNYPTHTLILYSETFADRKRLVCYIDLFSTFQFYVILNHNYDGEDVQKVYYQTILKQEKPKIDIRKLRMKDLLIVAGEIGVFTGDLKNKSIEEIYTFLEMKQKQTTLSYELNLSQFVHQISSRICLNLILREKGLNSYIKGVEKEILEATPKIERNDFFAIHYELERIENGSVNQYYKQNYIDVDEELQPSIHSTLSKMIEINNEHPDTFINYGHIKFFQLSHFIEINELDKKEKGINDSES